MAAQIPQLSGETLSSNPLLMLDMAHTWGKRPVISIKVLVLVHTLHLSGSCVISKISNISVTRKKNEITKTSCQIEGIDF